MRTIQFELFVYWYPNTQELTLQQVSNQRPPNELIERAKTIITENIDPKSYKNISDSTPIYVAKVRVGFSYRPSETQNNEIEPGEDYFTTFNQPDEYPMGEAVTGYTTMTMRGEEVEVPFQEEGWFNLTDTKYDSKEKKPEEWTSDTMYTIN